jgi:pimeloyl-ACP methyl ester carboxylesterase
MKKITKTLLSILSVSLVLQGGSDDSNNGPEPSGAAIFEPGTHPRFDPVIRDLPFNTDLIFAAAATSDGTADVGAATDSVRAALNMLDGFSTSAYFDILIQGSVNPASVLPMQTVFLVEVDTGGNDALNPANVVGLVGPAAFDTQVVSLDGGTNNAIRIRPTAPLKAKTKYLVILTNDIMDAGGQALTPSWTYNALGDPEYPTLGSLIPVRNAILGWEQLASGFLNAVTEGALSTAAATEKLVLTYTFTTTDPIAPLAAMAAPRAAIAGMQIAAGIPAGEAVGNVQALEGLGLLPTPKARPLAVFAATGIDFAILSGGLLAGNVGHLYTGYIQLPYYQTGPDNLAFGAFLSRNWVPDQTLAGALEVTVPADVGGGFNVTYRYPFAAKTADESVPLQVTLPEEDHVPGYAGVLTCGQIYAANGYPVVIYVHGITSDRSSVLALGHTLASQCIATVAIDLPMHGIPATSAFVDVLNVEQSQMIPFETLYGDNAPRERHFNVAGAGGAPAPMNFETPGATDGSGAQFINLGYLANTRDNNRQAVMDLLNLNASLASIEEEMLETVNVGFNLNRVYIVGQSLGGILGSVFATVNQIAIANDAQVGMAANLNPIRGIVASTAGSQVSQILVNSATFAPVINGGLAAAGVNVGTSNYERFLYAAQSTLDSGDPVNFAQTLGLLGVPALIQQVNGDLVIPNAPASAPLAGTEALADLLGAEQLGIGIDQPLGQGIVKLTAGDHASLLRPGSPATAHITVELQTQVVSFILNDGEITIGAGAPENVEEPEAAVD